MVHAFTNLPALRVVGPGLFELGKVRLDQNRRTVSFPAVLNQSDGVIEYLLVTTYGKTHESILRTEASALHLHVAMLLLHAKGAGTNLLQGPPPAYGGAPGLTIPGDPISIKVRWRLQGQTIVRRAEELVLDLRVKAELKGIAWVYNGSAVWEGTFLAQRDGSFISLINDPAALVNHAGPKPDDDNIWRANRDKLPPENIPVHVTIQLLEARPESR